MSACIFMKCPHYRTILFVVLALLLFVFGLAAFFPGVMTVDSIVQLAQAKSGILDDHHPPIMAAVWSALLLFGDGPAPMLMFHLGMYWLGIIVLGVGLLRDYPRAAFLLLFAWFLPPVMGMSGIIWKDTGLALSWFLCVCLLLRYDRVKERPPTWARVVIFLSFFYGLSVRYNACVAAPPLVFWMVSVFSVDKSLRFMTRVYQAVALFLLCMGAIIVFEKTIISRTASIHQELLLRDIFCISLNNGEILFPDYIAQNPKFSMARIRRQNDYIWPRVVFQTTDEVIYTQDPEKLKSLRSAWKSAIINHWDSYLQCRYDLWAAMMRIGYDEPYYPYNFRKPLLKEDGMAAMASNAAYESVKSYLKMGSKSIANMPNYWALLLLMALSSMWKTKRHPLRTGVVCLSFSGLLYALGYLPIGIDWDMRYVYWLIMSGVALILLLCFGHKPASASS